MPQQLSRRALIWKGKVFHDLSPVQAGDAIGASATSDSSRIMMADSIWLNIVNFLGVITRTGNNSFEVFTNPNADPQSAYRKENKTIELGADTVFENSARDALKLGRNVQVVGLDLKNGRIHATKVTVYDGKRPVEMRSRQVVLPNGQVR